MKILSLILMFLLPVSGFATGTSCSSKHVIGDFAGGDYTIDKDLFECINNTIAWLTPRFAAYPNDPDARGGIAWADSKGKIAYFKLIYFASTQTVEILVSKKIEYNKIKR